MVLDDPVAEREAEPRPLADVLGGEEGVEDPVVDRRGDPAAVVRNADFNLHGVRAGLDEDAATGRAGVDRVGDEALDHQIDLHREAGRLGDRGEVRLQRHLPVVGEVLHQADGRADPGVQVGFLEFGLFQMREVTQVGDDLLDPQQADARPLQQAAEIFEHEREVHLLGEIGDLRVQIALILRQGFGGLLVEPEDVVQPADLALEDFQVVGDEGERVVDLVRDPGRGLADAG